MPWQEKLITGFPKGEMVVMMSGRQAGKSAWSQQAIDRLMKDLNSRPIEELVLGEQPLHGARYYTVEPIGGNWMEMEAWVTKTFGDPGEIWPKQEFAWPETARWVCNNRKFWFRNERDRTMFIMRWSSL